MKLTPAIEDYLKTIYDLASQHGRISTTQIAETMDVKPASVTRMIQKLSAAERPLLEYKKHYGVILTSEGERVALEITRRHRLLEQFLHEIMGFSWDEIHEEAHRLEHVISDRFVERMAIALGDPRYDPHGAPIPTLDLEIPTTASVCMNELEVKQFGIIKQVPDNDPDLLRYLGQMGVTPDVRFEVLEFSPFDKNLKIRVADHTEPVVLGPSITREIFVEIEP